MLRVHAAWSETYAYCNASTRQTPELAMVNSRAFRRVTCGRCLELIAIKRERRLRKPANSWEPAWFFEPPHEHFAKRYSDLFTPEYTAIKQELFEIENDPAPVSRAASRRAGTLRRQLRSLIEEVPCRCDCDEDDGCECRRCLAARYGG